ncbi:MAG: helix-turn-helix transcriptional regulator [Sediminibacterium sp.]
MSDISIAVGQRIRKLREEGGYTQNNIAEALDMSAGAYAKIERGETDPSITRLYELAELMDTEVIKFLTDAPLQFTKKESVEIRKAVIDLDEQVTDMIAEMKSMREKMATVKKKLQKNNA